MNKFTQYLSLVKFSHTLFAMPFALIAYCYTLNSTGTPFEALLLVKILLAMVFARNTAMGFNRYADRTMDASNARTASREIPAGKIGATEALVFVAVNAVLFLLTALWINPLAFYLSPVALLVLVGYSYTKRFTAWCHVILGVALGIAPIGACIAVAGSIMLVPVLISGLVISWVAGFDIIYALQDFEFDRQNGLHSVPVRWGINRALVLSALLHLFTIYSVWVMLSYLGWNTLNRIGAILFVGLLVFQHLYVTPKHTARAGAFFGLLNGLSSVCFAAFVIAGMYLQ